MFTKVWYVFRVLFVFAFTMLALSGIVGAQPYFKVLVGGSNPNDTTYSSHHFRNDKTVRLPLYANEDTNRYLTINALGFLEYRHVSSGTSYVSGYGINISGDTISVDTNVIPTEFDLSQKIDIGDLVDYVTKGDSVTLYATHAYVNNAISSIPTSSEGTNPNYWITSRTGVALSSLPTGETTNYWPVPFLLNVARPDSVLAYTKGDGLQKLYSQISIDSGATFTLVDTFLSRSSTNAPNAVNWFYNQLQNPNGLFTRGDSIYTYFVYNNNSVAISSPLLTGLGLAIAPKSSPYRAARVHVNPVLTITQAQSDWSLVNAPDYITIGGRMVERDTVWAYVGVSRIVQATNRYTMICRYRVVDDTLFVPDRVLVRPQGQYTYICDFSPFKWTDSNYYASLTEAPLFTSANARVRYLKSTNGRDWEFMNGSFLSPLNVADDRSRNYCTSPIYYPDNTNRFLMPYKGGNSYRVLYSLTRGSADRFAMCEVYPNTFDAQIKDNQNNVILKNGLPGININPTNSMVQVGAISGIQSSNTNPLVIFGTGATTQVSMHTLASGFNFNTDGFLLGRLDSPMTKGVMGVRENLPLNVITNNIERLSLTASGNLLVGTTTDPGLGAKLHISGFMSLTSAPTYSTGGNVTLVRNTTTSQVESITLSTIATTGTARDLVNYMLVSETPIGTGSISLTSYHTKVRVNAGATITVTPTFAGQTFTWQQVGAGIVTVQLASGNINGAASVTTLTDTESKTFWYGGTNAFIE